MKPQGELEQLPLKQKILYGITNWTLLAAGIANLVIGTLAAFNESAPVAATSLTAGLVMLFAATVDRFEFLKGLGIEAKTKQLDQKIDQADDALRRLREMTEITGTALIDMSSRIGRFSGTPEPHESIAFANRVRQIMKKLDSEESIILGALRPWAKTLCFDMARIQTHELNQRLLDRLKKLKSELQNIKQPIQQNNPAHVQLRKQIKSIHDFQSRLSNLYYLELEDYPDKFIELFDDAPGLEASERKAFRLNAERFIPGMLSLRNTAILTDEKLWIDELQKAHEQKRL